MLNAENLKVFNIHIQHSTFNIGPACYNSDAMSVTLVSLSVWLVASVAIQAPAGKPGADARTLETSHLTVTTSTAAESAKAVLLFVDVTPKPNMHVYAPGQAGYITISLTIDRHPGFTVQAPRFPDPEKLYFKPLDETQLVYSKPFRIVDRLARSSGASRSPIDVKGTLKYQACDDKVCYRPQTVALTWSAVPQR
jgi:DsbC/DsbD-like thiol-disulfide interchange protein